MRRIRCLAVALVGVALVSGCSGGAERQAAADEEPMAPKIVRVAVTSPIAADPATLNPTHPIDVLVADLLFDGLTSYDGATRTVQPALASSWDTVDGVTWTFDLDATRTTSTGEPITADLVVASLRRVLAGASTSLGAGRLADAVASVDVAGPTAVTVVGTGPNQELPTLLADPTYGIVPGADVPALGLDLDGTGSFRVDAGGPDAVSLVPIDDAAGVDGIEFVQFDDVAAAQAALADGDVDIAPLTDGAAAPEGSTEALVSAATLVLEVSSANGPLADPARHAALVAALDRSAVAAAVTGSPDRVAGTLVPGGALDGDPCDGVCGAAPAPLTGASVHLDAPAGVPSETGNAEIARQLTAMGVTTELRPTDAAGLQATLAAGGMDLATFVVAGVAPTPDPYLAAVLGSAGAENLSGYSSAEFDAGLAAARALTDPAARQAEYVRLEASVLAAAPVIPLATLGQRFGVAERVSGVVPFAGRLFDGTRLGLR